MQSNGTFDNTYDYYATSLQEIAAHVVLEDGKLADACMYAVDVINLLKSLNMDLPCRLRFEFERSRIRFEWDHPDGSLVVFLIADEEIRSLVYKENNTIIEMNTVQRGSLNAESFNPNKRQCNV